MQGNRIAPLKKIQPNVRLTQKTFTTLAHFVRYVARACRS
jgi:hypothetical protein